MPKPSLVCVENTHMAASGMPWHPADLEAVRPGGGRPSRLHGRRSAVQRRGGDRSLPAADACAGMAAVMCCMSKGLCAPVGSLLAGEADMIAEARMRTTPPRRSDAPGGHHRCGRARRPRHDGGAPGRRPPQGDAARRGRRASVGPTRAAIPSGCERTSSSSRTRTRRSCIAHLQSKGCSPARSRLTSCDWSPTTTSTTRDWRGRGSP